MKYKARYGLDVGSGWEVAENAARIPLNVGLGYYHGLQIGQGLGLDESSQIRLGRMNALNMGLSSTSTFFNSLQQRREAKDRQAYLQSLDYINQPYDRYAYNSYLGGPRQGNYFQAGGLISPVAIRETSTVNKNLGFNDLIFTRQQKEYPNLIERATDWLGVTNFQSHYDKINQGVDAYNAKVTPYLGKNKVSSYNMKKGGEMPCYECGGKVKYEDGGTYPDDPPEKLNSNLEQKNEYRRRVSEYQAQLDAEIARVKNVRQNITTSAERQFQRNSRTRTRLPEYSAYCHTRSCEVLQDAGATVARRTRSVRNKEDYYEPGEVMPIIPGNMSFVARAESLGFEKVRPGEYQAGDIIQRIEDGIPVHSMIYADNKGRTPIVYSDPGAGTRYDRVPLKGTQSTQGWRYVGNQKERQDRLNRLLAEKAYYENLQMPDVTMLPILQSSEVPMKTRDIERRPEPTRVVENNQRKNKEPRRQESKIDNIADLYYGRMQEGGEIDFYDQLPNEVVFDAIPTQEYSLDSLDSIGSLSTPSSTQKPSIPQTESAPKGGSIAVSHNNPGNIKYGDFAKQYGATPGRKATDGGIFAVFPDIETGLVAQRNLLQGKNYRNLTVADAMRRWSNNGYAGEIYPAVANKRMSELTESERQELQRRQIKREDGDMFRIVYGR